MIPRVDETSYVHPSAVLIGDVEIGPLASVWPHAVLRGDVAPIRVGEEANVQDGAVLHADPGSACIIGDRVSVGHRAIVHGASIGEDTLVGMGAIVLEGVQVGTGALIAAGAVVREGTIVADGSLMAGVPAKLVRTDPALGERNANNAKRYLDYAMSLRSGKHGPDHGNARY